MYREPKQRTGWCHDVFSVTFSFAGPRKRATRAAEGGATSPI